MTKQARDNRGRFTNMVCVHCDQCSMLSINGIACHELGCPNFGARWDRDNDTWVKQRKCFICGYTVDVDDQCCSSEDR